MEGVLAALHDLRATATNDYEFPMPAISEDRRHALVALMPKRPNPQIALVSMDDGKILQTVPQPGGIYVTGGTGSHAIGFAQGGAAGLDHRPGIDRSL